MGSRETRRDNYSRSKLVMTLGSANKIGELATPSRRLPMKGDT